MLPPKGTEPIREVTNPDRGPVTSRLEPASPALAASHGPSSLASEAGICESRPGFYADTMARVFAESSPRRDRAQGIPLSGKLLRIDLGGGELLLKTERVASLNKTSGVSGTVNLGHPAAFVR